MKYLVCSILMMLVSLTVLAQDRAREIDLAYSKIVSSLPAEGQLLLAPYVTNYDHYGDAAGIKVVENSRAIGGQALQVRTKQKGTNPWDVGVVSAISGEFNSGDVLFMMFWARAAALPKDKSFSVISNVGIQKASEPYSAIMSKTFNVNENWKTFAMAAKASTGYSHNETQVSFQLASDKHTIELGPVFVINLGPNIDIKTLPFLTP